MDTENIDFEDILKQFEEQFANCARGRKVFADDDVSEQGLSSEEASIIKVSMDDFRPELEQLFQEIVRKIHLNRQTAARTSTSLDAGIHFENNGRYMDTDVNREIYRTEMRTIMSKLQSLEMAAPDDELNMPSSQRSTIASLKRQNREKSDELVRVSLRSKQIEVQNRRMEDLLDSYRASIEEYQGTNVALSDQVDDLRNRGHENEKLLREAQGSEKKLRNEKQRLERNVSMLRAELLSSHHSADAARLETRQARRRVKELEQRANEGKMSEAAVLVRVKELQEIQDQMIVQMTAARHMTDVPAARRAIANLKDQRSRIVGRIASILTKRSTSTTATTNRPASVREDNFEDLLGNPTTGMPSVAKTFSSESVAKETGTQSLFGIASTTEVSEDGQNRKRGRLFKQLSSVADEDKPFIIRRSAKKKMYANVEKTRVAVEKDTAALREVIELKDSELNRMDDELQTAREQAETLERQLQHERQNRRQENRNLRIPTVEVAKQKMTHATDPQRRKQTLFEWQSNTATTTTSTTVTKTQDSA